MRLLVTFLATAISLLPALSFAYQLVDEADYSFQLHNPFAATITGTPPQQWPKLPGSGAITQKDYWLRLHPEREQSLPNNFWPVKTLGYRLAQQAGPAPLIFIIAGTGARYDSQTSDYLKQLFYGAGMHVVQLSSPTSYDFMSAASVHATPGFSPLDARELYQLMQRIAQKHHDLPVTRWHLTGYSLGGLHAGFVSELDSREQRFNFSRTLMLNPPVNLYTSVSNLDQMASVRLDNTHEGHSFYEEIIEKTAGYFQKKGHFSPEKELMAHLMYSPERLSDEQMAMLIGTVFRFMVTDISFTADLINRRGLITPADARITDGTSLTPFFEIALMCDFACYIDEQLLPFWQQHFHNGNLQELAQQTSLYAIASHLRNNPNIGAMHNQDDFILGQGDLGFLQEQLQERLMLYPYGGHLGNLNHYRNAADILEFFHEE